MALNQIVTDLETGHHLLHPDNPIRQGQYYKNLMEEVKELNYKNLEDLSDRQLEIQEFMKQCSDCAYWISLPNEEQYF